jgi:NADH dehydrogenase
MSGATRQQPEAVSAVPHVIIVGAGFAGLAAVAGLKKADVRVTIIDRNLYSTFQPLLYQVATGGLNPGDVAYPVGGFTTPRRARYLRGDLAALDTEARTVRLRDGRELGYDYLIVASGVSAAYFGVQGAAENTFGLYTRADAIVLRDHIMAGFERLSAQNGQSELAITVVGGGATGVELAGTLGELRRVVLHGTFPDVDPSRVHIRLVEMAPALLMPFNERLREYTRRQLVARGVDIRLNTTIREVRPSSVILDGEEVLPSDLTVWAAGVAAPEAIAKWGLPQGKGGRILVGEDLRVQGQERIFAIGDIGLNPDKPTPQLAQPAIQEGKRAAASVARLIAGQPAVPFSYHDKGTMATIGRRAAVVELPRGPRITGTLAWFAWLALHLFYLLGGRNRVSTLINLSWRYIDWGHGGNVIVGDDPAAGEDLTGGGAVDGGAVRSGAVGSGAESSEAVAAGQELRPRVVSHRDCDTPGCCAGHARPGCPGRMLDHVVLVVGWLSFLR